MKRVLITQSGFVMVVLVAPADIAATMYTKRLDSWCPKVLIKWKLIISITSCKRTTPGSLRHVASGQISSYLFALLRVP